MEINVWIFLFSWFGQETENISLISVFIPFCGEGNFFNDNKTAIEEQLLMEICLEFKFFILFRGFYKIINCNLFNTILGNQSLLKRD